MDEVGQGDAAMKEPRHEEKRSTVEKEDFDVDYVLPVSSCRIDGPLTRGEAECQCAVDVVTS